MATRFWMPSAGTAPVTPPPDAFWDQIAELTQLPLVRTPSNTAIIAPNAVGHYIAETTTTSPWDVAIRQYSSAPIAQQTISGTFSFVAKALESAGTADMFIQLVIKVVAPDESVRGVLYAGNTSTTLGGAGTPNQEMSSGGTRIYNAQAVSSVATENGDHLVLEVGYRALNTTATSRQGGVEQGDPTSGTDYALAADTGTGNRPWIEFSSTIAPATLPYADEVDADNPIAWYRLGETSGTNAADSSGNGRNGGHQGSGTTLGVAGLLVGDTNPAAQFNGSGWVSVPDAAWMDTTVGSVEGLFTTTQTGVQYLAGRFDSGTDYLMMLDLQASNVVRVYALISGVSRSVQATVAGMRDGNRHQVVGTYDGTDLKLYVDGVQVATGNYPGTLSGSTAPFLIGKRNDTNSNRLIGKADEVALYDTALSADRVLAHWLAALTEAPEIPPLSLGLATETDTALGLTAPLMLGVATEANTALPLENLSTDPWVETGDEWTNLSGSGAAGPAPPELPADTAYAVPSPPTAGSYSSRLGPLPAVAGKSYRVGLWVYLDTEMGPATIGGSVTVSACEADGTVSGGDTFGQSMSNAQPLRYVQGTITTDGTNDHVKIVVLSSTSPADEPATMYVSGIWITEEEINALELGVAIESDTALPVDVAFGTAVEIDTALPLNAEPLPLGVAVESDSGLQMVGDLPLGTATETDTALFLSLGLIMEGTTQHIAFNQRWGTPDLRLSLDLVILDAVLIQAPTAVQVTVAGADAGETLTFFIDDVEVWTTTAGPEGDLGVTSVPVPEDVMGGTHTLRVSSPQHGYDEESFVVRRNPSIYPVEQVVDADPVFVPGSTGSWVLQDVMPGGLGSWVMPINPTSMTPPHLQKLTNTQHTTAIRTGQHHVNEQGLKTKDWSVSGYCPDEAFHNQLVAYAELNRRIYVIDHRGRAWKVAITSLALTPRKRQVEEGVLNDWAHNYKLDMLIVDQTALVPA